MSRTPLSPFGLPLLGTLSLGTLCCGPDQGQADGGPGASGAGAAQGGGAGTGSGTGGQGGSGAGLGGTAAGGSSGAAGGNGAVECTGAFGPPELLFSDEDTGSLSVTADELELFYSSASGAKIRTRQVRGEAFGEPTTLDQLANACEADKTIVTLDVSEDGLRLYFTCSSYDTVGHAEEPLMLAERESRSAEFDVADEPVGFVTSSFGVSADELVVYSLQLDIDTVSGQTTMWERSSTDDPFGGPSAVPGITVQFAHPDESKDGLALYGALRPDYRLAVASRRSAGAGFSAPVTDGLPSPPMGQRDASPAISADCRTLYFTRLPSASSTTSLIEAYVAHR